MPVQVPLVSAIVKAWQATAKGRRGLFDRSFDSEAFRNSTDAIYNFGPLVDSISAHYMWLTYLDEVWKARLALHTSLLCRSSLRHDCWWLSSLPRYLSAGVAEAMLAQVHRNCLTCLGCQWSHHHFLLEQRRVS